MVSKPEEASCFTPSPLSSSMTLYGSNQVYPSAWLEIVAHPFTYRIDDGDSRARTVTVAITMTDYRGNEHHQTLIVSVV